MKGYNEQNKYHFLWEMQEHLHIDLINTQDQPDPYIECQIFLSMEGLQQGDGVVPLAAFQPWNAVGYIATRARCYERNEVVRVQFGVQFQDGCVDFLFKIRD